MIRDFPLKMQYFACLLWYFVWNLGGGGSGGGGGGNNIGSLVGSLIGGGGMH